MLAKRPPMGWNSWNTFGENINESLIKEMADVMVDQGSIWSSTTAGRRWNGTKTADWSPIM